MKLTQTQTAKIQKLLDRVAADVYPEPPSELHTQITLRMTDRFFAQSGLTAGSTLLDIGCGSGPALAEFRKRGCSAIGITLGHHDLDACRQQGFDVRFMDQSFLDFEDGAFDGVWARHCLEHSVIPYLTLLEFHRVLRPGGALYVEVPAPDTSCAHQTNRNHYSVLGKSMWAQLMIRAGFGIIEVQDIKITTAAGPDVYWAFILNRQ